VRVLLLLLLLLLLQRREGVVKIVLDPWAQ
jgi:hypothetical protein